VLAASGDHLELGDAWRVVEVRFTGELATGRLSDLVGAWVVAELAAPAPDADLTCRSLHPVTPPGRARRSPRSAALLCRGEIMRRCRAYFTTRGFLEVTTPSFGSCPGLDANVHALSSVALAHGTEFLMTSPEFFMKRLLADGHPRIFQLCSSYRSEELGIHHEPEFSLLEWYRSFETESAL